MNFIPQVQGHKWTCHTLRRSCLTDVNAVFAERRLKSAWAGRRRLVALRVDGYDTALTRPRAITGH
jgi:hypothetical protein